MTAVRRTTPAAFARSSSDNLAAAGVNITGNWIRMVELAGNGNGGSCDGIYDGRQLNSSCWLNTDNWMNGEMQPTWINHTAGYVAPTDYKAPFPAAARAVIAAAGPRPR